LSLRPTEHSVLHNHAKARPTRDSNENGTVTLEVRYAEGTGSSGSRVHLTQGAAWDLFIELSYALRGIRHG
jgi:hypothetical protein